MHTSFPSSSIDASTRRALFAALEDPAVQQEFLDSLRRVKEQSLEVLRDPETDHLYWSEAIERKQGAAPNEHDVGGKREPRSQYLAAESMLLAHSKGASPKEQTELLLHFIKDALDHAAGKKMPTYSRRSLLQKTFAEKAEKKPESVRLALEHLSKDLKSADDTAAPDVEVDRRDLLKKAGMGAVVGYAAGAVAGRVADHFAPAPGIPALDQYVKPIDIDMAIGSLTGAIYKYCTSHGIIIEEKEFAAELDRIMSATASYCESYAVKTSGELTFIHALKTNTQFRVEFLDTLTKKRDAVQQKILDQGVPTESEIHEFLACDSILNAYSHSSLVGQPTETITQPDGKKAYQFIEETLGDETGNAGRVAWLVTYLKHVIDPQESVESPDKRKFLEKMTSEPDFSQPHIVKSDMRIPANLAMVHLRSLTDEYKPARVPKIWRDQDAGEEKEERIPFVHRSKAMSAHRANPAAREAIDRITPKPNISRRDFNHHMMKGAIGGMGIGIGVAAAADSVSGVHITAEKIGMGTSETLISGAFIGSLVGGLYYHWDKDSITDKKKAETEIKYVFSKAAAFCLEEAKNPIRSATR